MTDSRHQVLDIAQIEIQVRELEPSLLFYQQRFGFNLVYQNSEMALLTLGEYHFLLTQTDVVQPSEHLIICLQVKDIFATYQYLLDSDVIFKQAPHSISQTAGIAVWQAFACDPDGHLVGLQSQL